MCVGGSLCRWSWENLCGSVGRLVTRDFGWPWLAHSKQLEIHDYLGNQITGKAVTWQFLQPPLFSLHVMFNPPQHIHQHSPLHNKLLGSQDSAWREMRGKWGKQRPQTWGQRNRVFQTQVRVRDEPFSLATRFGMERSKAGITWTMPSNAMHVFTEEWAELTAISDSVLSLTFREDPYCGNWP